MVQMRGSLAWRVAAVMAPTLICVAIVLVLLTIYGSTEPGTTHRAAELLLIPALIATMVFGFRILFSLFELARFRRRGGWGFDPQSGAFYGEYGESFDRTPGASRRRRRSRR